MNFNNIAALLRQTYLTEKPALCHMSFMQANTNSPPARLPQNGNSAAMAAIASLPCIERGFAVPKIIHQTYPSSDLSPVILMNIASLKDINPGWAYRFYTDEDIRQFIETAYGAAMIAYFDRINPAYGAARADFFRYLLMYHTGGVYLDIKSAARLPLDEVLLPDDRFILSNWRNQTGEIHAGSGLWPELEFSPRGELQQWHIIACAGHPFLQKVILDVLRNIDQYNPRTFGTGKLGVLRVTGPIAYTRAIYPQRFMAGTRIIRDETELGLQYSIFSGGEHSKIFTSHYKTRFDPVIRRTGWLGVLESRFYSMKTFKRNAVAALRGKWSQLSVPRINEDRP